MTSNRLLSRIQSQTCNVSQLSDLGCQEEALHTIEEAVKLYRPLVLDHPVAFNRKFSGLLQSSC